MDRPRTIHDFGGFPQALYELQYPAPGAPELAVQAIALLRGAGFEAAADETRGFDHGAWVPLRHLFPTAEVPVFQVSMPRSLDTRSAVLLGQALSPLRDSGVLIIGSGCLTHNLHEFRQRATGYAPYAVAFSQWVREAIQAGDIGRLIDYRRQAPHAEWAHPTEDHFLPLLVALGAAGDRAATAVIDGGITYGVISMDAYVLGEAA